MSLSQAAPRPRKILLSGVFGPFGVDDEFGRKENIMELFHNQVTRGQGVASFRFFHRSFGLYFLAANIDDADVTVLDFPSRARFEREVKNGGYDMVGISFIAPNMAKAKEMARLTRLHARQATIIVGGHGAAIEGVEQLVDCDHVVKGEGIRWLRSFLGQDPDAPLRHPALPSAESEAIYGIPVPGNMANLLVPGVGCVNACKFCATSHFFGREYSSFIRTGKEMFELACRIADERGSDDFFVMDENFLKDRTRAMELLAEMERHRRYFRFHIFSSAEAITAFGVDNLARLGVTFVWIGVESSSPRGNFLKNKDIDARALIKQLRDRGMVVLASGILCQEHHTPDNIQQDIDFMCGLEADMVQFMLLTPLPVTALYEDHKRRGLLREDLPLEEWHGQKHLSFKHPAFPGDLAQRTIDDAFRQEYEANSATLYRVTETALRGYRTLKAMANGDPLLEYRAAQQKKTLFDYAPTLPGVAHFAVNEAERRRARELDRQIQQTFGPHTLAHKLKCVAVMGLMIRWRLRVKLRGDGIQPRTIVTRFVAGEGRGNKGRVRGFELPRAEQVRDWVRVAAKVAGGMAPETGGA